MKLAALLSIAALSIAAVAHAADVQAVLASVKHGIETSDYRASGQLVRVEANGNRIRYSLAVKGLWFAGALHMLVDLVPPKADAAQAPSGGPIRLLLEMRPDGRGAIRILRPGQTAPTLLPFDRWNQSLLGGAFSYEDLLEPQFFWPGQTILKTARFGSHDCYVLKSTPGPADPTHDSEVETWLDRAIDYPVYAERTERQSGIVKQFTYFGLRQSSGVWSATQVEVKIRGRAGSTLLIVKRGSANAHLTPNDFSSAQVSRFEDRP